MSVVFQEGVLSDIARVTMGQSPKKEFVSSTQEGLPLLNGPTEFGSSHPTPVQWSTSFSKTAEPGDILFCVRGSTTGRMNWADQQYAIGRGIASISAINPQERHFVRAAIDLVLPELLAAATGSTFPNVSRLQLSELPVALPSAAVRTEISGLLGALDDKIESNLRTISLSESLILAHFSQLFNSGHVSAGTALSDLMEVNPRYSLKRESLAIKVSMQDIPSDSPVINTHSVMPVGAGSRFSNGDVLFARISPCLENGKTAVVDFLSGSEVGFGSTEFIILSPRGEISTTWIYALAREPSFREACRQAMTGSSGRQRLSADFFSRYTIATPKELDLVAFNKATMPLLTLMGERRDENQRLAQLRDARLPELMSGRMRVDEAGCLVSEALDEEVADV